MPSGTYQSYALLRSNLKSSSDADIANAVAYGKRVKVYPLSQAAHPPDTQFIDAINVVFDATIPYDIRFFQSLDRMVQAEPWLQRDRAMIDQLKSIGIEKGKPFNPDTATQDILKRAVLEAHDGKSNQTSPKPSRQTMQIRTAIPTDSRGLAYSYAYFSAKHLGAGQYYLMTIKDKQSQPFEGSGNYRLNVPANAPVTLYWSATAYDRETHALIRNMQWPSRASTTSGLQKNADGSVDLYFGPKAPAGKESNWIPTDSNGKFEVLFRFYGPQKPLFDKTWKLPDIEKTN